MADTPIKDLEIRESVSPPPPTEDNPENFWTQEGLEAYDASIFEQEKIDLDDLRKNESFIMAGRHIYEMHEGEGTAKNITDEEAVNYAIDEIRWFNNNVVQTGWIASTVHGATDEQKVAFLYAMEAYNKTGYSWGGFGRFLYQGVAADPGTLASIGIGALTFGLGGVAAKAGATAGVEATKKLLIELLKTTAKETVTGSLKKRLAMSAFNGAVTGAADAGITNKFEQDVKRTQIHLDGQRFQYQEGGFNWGEFGTATAFGAGFGGAFGLGGGTLAHGLKLDKRMAQWWAKPSRSSVQTEARILAGIAAGAKLVLSQAELDEMATENAAVMKNFGISRQALTKKAGEVAETNPGLTSLEAHQKALNDLAEEAQAKPEFQAKMDGAGDVPTAPKITDAEISDHFLRLRRMASAADGHALSQEAIDELRKTAEDNLRLAKEFGIDLEKVKAGTLAEYQDELNNQVAKTVMERSKELAGETAESAATEGTEDIGDELGDDWDAALNSVIADEPAAPRAPELTKADIDAELGRLKTINGEGKTDAELLELARINATYINRFELDVDSIPGDTPQARQSAILAQAQEKFDAADAARRAEVDPPTRDEFNRAAGGVEAPEFAPGIDKFKFFMRRRWNPLKGFTHWAPVTAMNMESRPITRPVIKFIDDLMNQKGLTGNLQKMQKDVLGSSTVADAEKIIDAFATNNKHGLTDMRVVISGLKEKISKEYLTADELNTSTATREFLHNYIPDTLYAGAYGRYGLTAGQKEKLLAHLTDMDDMAADLLDGSKGKNGQQIIATLEKINNGEFTKEAVEKSVNGLSKAHFEANNCYIRTENEWPTGGKATAQWRERLERSIQSEHHNPEPPDTLLSYRYLNKENIEKTWQNQILEYPEKHLATKDADGNITAITWDATKIPPFVGHLKTMYDGGFGQEVAYSLDELSRRRQRWGGGELDILPTKDEVQKILREDPRYEPNLKESTAPNPQHKPGYKKWADQVISQLEKIETEADGAPKEGPLRFIQNNRPNQHFYMSRSYPYRFAQRYSYTQDWKTFGMATPGFNYFYKKYGKLPVQQALYFFGGYKEAKIVNDLNDVGLTLKMDPLRISKENKEGIGSQLRRSALRISSGGLINDTVGYVIPKPTRLGWVGLTGAGLMATGYGLEQAFPGEENDGPSWTRRGGSYLSGAALYGADWVNWATAGLPLSIVNRGAGFFTGNGLNGFLSPKTMTTVNSIVNPAGYLRSLNKTASGIKEPLPTPAEILATLSATDLTQVKEQIESVEIQNIGKANAAALANDIAASLAILEDLRTDAQGRLAEARTTLSANTLEDFQGTAEETTAYHTALAGYEQAVTNAENEVAGINGAINAVISNTGTLTEAANQVPDLEAGIALLGTELKETLSESVRTQKQAEKEKLEKDLTTAQNSIINSTGALLPIIAQCAAAQEAKEEVVNTPSEPQEPATASQNDPNAAKGGTGKKEETGQKNPGEEEGSVDPSVVDESVDNAGGASNGQTPPPAGQTGGGSGNRTRGPQKSFSDAAYTIWEEGLKPPGDGSKLSMFLENSGIMGLRGAQNGWRFIKDKYGDMLETKDGRSWIALGWAIVGGLGLGALAQRFIANIPIINKIPLLGLVASGAIFLALYRGLSDWMNPAHQGTGQNIPEELMGGPETLDETDAHILQTPDGGEGEFVDPNIITGGGNRTLIASNVVPFSQAAEDIKATAVPHSHKEGAPADGNIVSLASRRPTPGPDADLRMAM